jgi:hypothetical protein
MSKKGKDLMVLNRKWKQNVKTFDVSKQDFINWESEHEEKEIGKEIKFEKNFQEKVK